MVAVIVISLLFPCSSSVLCIAPDHVAIEDLNSACCERLAVSFRADNPSDNGFAAAGTCQNCIDILLTPNARGAVLNSFVGVAPNLSAYAFPGNYILPDDSFRACLSGLHNNLTALIPVSPSLPLRC